MRATLRTTSTLAAALLLAACGPGTSTTAPTSAVGTNPPAATTGASSAATAAAAVCTEPAAGTATDVDASVGGNAWGPVAAKVGEVITWTNSDTVSHKVGLDDGSCTMSNNITGSAPQSLVFTAPGSYPFHCTIHSSMKSTIEIS